jgi:hypothetical protein
MSWVKDKDFMHWFESTGGALVNMTAVYAAWIAGADWVMGQDQAMIELSEVSEELGLAD